MKLKINVINLIIVFLIFSSCDNKIKYDSRIINYDYKKFDGMEIANRSSDFIILRSFKKDKDHLIFVKDTSDMLKIVKKPKDYILTDEEIISYVKEYQKLNAISCYVDCNDITRVVSYGIVYVKINKNYNGPSCNFYKKEYQDIGNNWYIQKIDMD